MEELHGTNVERLPLGTGTIVMLPDVVSCIKAPSTTASIATDSATIIAAIVIELPLTPISVPRVPILTARWPILLVTSCSWPVPRCLGSSPGVQLVGVVDGVVSKTQARHETGGGVGGGGVPDEPRAAAAVRTTTSGPIPSDATTVTRSAVPPPSQAAVLLRDAGDHACNARADDIITIIVIDISSLLRDDGISIAPQRSVSSSSGRRGSSGRPRGADRIPTGSLTPPLTSELRRAA